MEELGHARCRPGNDRIGLNGGDTVESTIAARVLVVADQTAATPKLVEAVRDRAAAAPAEFHRRRTRVGLTSTPPQVRTGRAGPWWRNAKPRSSIRFVQGALVMGTDQDSSFYVLFNSTRPDAAAGNHAGLVSRREPSRAC